MNILWDNLFRRQKKDEEIRSALRGNPLFQDLTEGELKFVQGVVHIRKFHAGEYVFRQGELGVGMYIIARGRIEVLIADDLEMTDDPREIPVTQLSAEDFFGEIALVEEPSRRTASAVAREESVLIGFFKPDLLEIIKRSPSSGIKILSRLAEVLGRRLKETTNKVTELRRAMNELRDPTPPGN